MASSSKRCGNCELLVRSSTPGLATYGKCPHRSGWVRAHDEPCEWHQGEPQGPVVKIAMALNLVAATFGAAFAVWMSVRHGNTLTNVLLAAAGVTVLAFGWFVWKRGLFSEEAKYELLDREELPPEEERTPPRF